MGNPIASIGASVIGGMMGNKAAKSDAAAQRYAIDQNNRGFDLAQPYIKNMYEGGTDALNNMVSTGAYQGPTYAGMDPRAAAGYNYANNFATNAMGAPQNFMNAGQGFGTNYQNIYNRASGPTLNNAVSYATGGASQPLIDAAMRDSTRQLNEQTLPSIGMDASATGNTNSSRAGVAQAIAQRAYDDRRADVAATIQDRMVDRYRGQNNQDINNMIAANRGLQNTYGIGFGMAPEIANMMTTAGGAFQTDAQGRMDADRSAFERNRDFNMDAYNTYASGILGQAPRTSSQGAVMANPYTAGLGGAMAGFGFGNKYLGNLFNAPPTTTTPTVAPTYTANPYIHGNDMVSF